MKFAKEIWKNFHCFNNYLTRKKGSFKVLEEWQNFSMCKAMKIAVNFQKIRIKIILKNSTKHIWGKIFILGALFEINKTFWLVGDSWWEAPKRLRNFNFSAKMTNPSKFAKIQILSYYYSNRFEIYFPFAIFDWFPGYLFIFLKTIIFAEYWNFALVSWSPVQILCHPAPILLSSFSSNDPRRTCGQLLV